MEVFPLRLDPMTPVKLAWHCAVGGYDTAEHAYLTTDTFGTLFTVDLEFGEPPFYNKEASEEFLRVLLGDGTSLDNIEWLMEFVRLDEMEFFDIDSVFYEGCYDFGEPKTHIDVDWSDDRMQSRKEEEEFFAACDDEEE